VDKASEKDDCQRGAIVLEKHTQGVAEKAASAKFAAHVCYHEDKKSGNDGEIELLSSTEMFEDLDALLEVDKGDVKPKYVTGEACDPSKPVAGVCYGKNTVKDK
jgi:hypothetical protein